MTLLSVARSKSKYRRYKEAACGKDARYASVTSAVFALYLGFY